jgi:ankyrin repeat protein
MDRCALQDLLDQKIQDLCKSRTIGAWIARLYVFVALRLLREDMDLVKRPDVFDFAALDDQIDKTNSELSTALHIAAAGCNNIAVCTLLAWKADYTVLNREQKSPLDLAKGSCVDLLARMTKQRSVDNKQIKEFGWTALMVAAEVGLIEQIDRLLEQDNNINARNSRQQSALHVAALTGNSYAVKRLIEKKANIEDRDEKQHTALCSAAVGGYTNCIHHLVEAGADLTIVVCESESLDSSTIPQTLLDLAVGQKCIELLKGCGVNGWTHLMVAVERGPCNVEMVLNTRDSLICLHTGLPFSERFQRALQLYSSLSSTPQTWKWGEYEPENLVVSEDGCKVSKVKNDPDYSCALGDVVFEAGVHRWTLKVKNVSSMWVGVARLQKKNSIVVGDQLCVSPVGTQMCDACIIAFGSGPSDVRVLGQNGTEITFLSQSDYSDGQTLDFELDLYNGTLKFSVDGILVVVVSNIDKRELQPYVCMDFSETVELLYSASFIADELFFSSTEDHLAAAERDITKYSEEFDAELMRLSPKDLGLEPGMATILGFNSAGNITYISSIFTFVCF